MAHIRADRVLETTTTTGTGNITVAGAIAGFGALSARLAVSDTFDYAIFAVDGSGAPTGAWETGVGTYTGTNQFSRSVRQSSNADALVNFASGTKYVALTLTTSAIAALGGGTFTPLEGLPGTVPALSSFTQLGFGTDVPTEQAGKAIVIPSTNGFDIKTLYKTAPATPYMVAIALARFGLGDSTRFCAGFRDPGTGRMKVLLLTSDTMFLQGYNNPASYSGISTTLFNLSLCKHLWFGLQNNGTNLIYRMSFDGVTFVTIATEAISGNFCANPTEIFFGAQRTGGSSEVVICRAYDEAGLSRTYT